MSKFASIMYRIGRIANYILLGIAILMLTLGAVALVMDTVKDPNLEPVNDLASHSLWLLWVGGFLLVANACLIGSISFCARALKENPDRLAAHVLLLVLGLASLDLFFPIGAISCLKNRK